jgi:hypothetical protein
MARDDENERSGGYTSFADMRDGGGAGRSGSRFEGGGILSDFANMVATPRASYGSDTGQMRPVARPSMAGINAARDRVNAPYSLGRDLLDGGGLGRRATLAEINSGRGFRGGVPSMLANMVGIRPMGANDLGLIASYEAALASNPQVATQMGLDDRRRETPVAEGLLGTPSDLDRAISAPEPITVTPLGPRFLDQIRTSLSQTPDQMFSQQLQDAFGVDRAIEIMSSPSAAQVFSEFTANGNQLPSQFSDSALNIGVYGDPLGRGTMVAR